MNENDSKNEQVANKGMDREVYIHLLKEKMRENFNSFDEPDDEEFRRESLVAVDKADTVGDLILLMAESSWDIESAFGFCLRAIIKDPRPDEFANLPASGEWDT